MFLLDKPGPPINLKPTDLTKTSTVLKWDPPKDDGGSPITGYYIERMNPYGTRWVKVNKEPITERKMPIDDMEEGNEYKFRVMAENAAGVGEPCEPISVIAKDPFDPPEAPGQPIVEDIMPETADLAWAPPASDGGAPIENYVVEFRAVGEKKWRRANQGVPVPDPKWTAPGLKKEVDYEFRVAAENKAGTGPFSPPSEARKYGE